MSIIKLKKPTPRDRFEKIAIEYLDYWFVYNELDRGILNQKNAFASLLETEYNNGFIDGTSELKSLKDELIKMKVEHDERIQKLKEIDKQCEANERRINNALSRLIRVFMELNK